MHQGKMSSVCYSIKYCWGGNEQENITHNEDKENNMDKEITHIIELVDKGIKTVIIISSRR